MIYSKNLCLNRKFEIDFFQDGGFGNNDDLISGIRVTLLASKSELNLKVRVVNMTKNPTKFTKKFSFVEDFLIN